MFLHISMHQVICCKLLCDKVCFCAVSIIDLSGRRFVWVSAPYNAKDARRSICPKCNNDIKRGKKRVVRRSKRRSTALAIFAWDLPGHRWGVALFLVYLSTSPCAQSQTHKHTTAGTTTTRAPIKPRRDLQEITGRRGHDDATGRRPPVARIQPA